jgi:quercetin dioxygenase-like cupin family protein
MEVRTLPEPSEDVDIASLLTLGPQTEGAIDVGTASFPPGVRFPETGFSVHEQHEVSLLLEGEFVLETLEGTHIVKAGQMIHFLPGEQHAATAVSEARVFYILFGAPVEGD